VNLTQWALLKEKHLCPMSGESYSGNADLIVLKVFEVEPRG